MFSLCYNNVTNKKGSLPCYQHDRPAECVRTLQPDNRRPVDRISYFRGFGKRFSGNYFFSVFFSLTFCSLYATIMLQIKKAACRVGARQTCRVCKAPYNRITGALWIGYHIFTDLARGFRKIGFFVMEFFRVVPRSACLRGFFARKNRKSGGKRHVRRQECPLVSCGWKAVENSVSLFSVNKRNRRSLPALERGNVLGVCKAPCSRKSGTHGLGV